MGKTVVLLNIFVENYKKNYISLINRSFKRRQFIVNIIFCNIIHVFKALLIKWVCLCWIKVLFPLKKEKYPLTHPKQSCTTSFFPEEMFTSVVLQHADEWWHVNHEYKQEWHETFLPNWTRQLWLLLYSELVKEEFSDDDYVLSFVHHECSVALFSDVHHKYNIDSSLQSRNIWALSSALLRFLNLLETFVLICDLLSQNCSLMFPNIISFKCLTWHTPAAFHWKHIWDMPAYLM